MVAGTEQVPATVINYGNFNSVPYISFRCAANGYEINVFGDLNNPAAVQIGAMNYLKQSDEARSNCVNFICSVLANPDDRKAVRTLNWNQQDSQNNSGMTFQILQPGEMGSYGGWWVSVYNENALASARASEAELASLTQPRAAAPQPMTTATNAAAQPAAAPSPPARRRPPTTGDHHHRSGVVTTYGARLSRLDRGGTGRRPGGHAGFQSASAADTASAADRCIREATIERREVWRAPAIGLVVICFTKSSPNEIS